MNKIPAGSCGQGKRLLTDEVSTGLENFDADRVVGTWICRYIECLDTVVVHGVVHARMDARTATEEELRRRGGTLGSIDVAIANGVQPER